VRRTHDLIPFRDFAFDADAEFGRRGDGGLEAESHEALPHVGLAARLRARAESVLLRDQPHQAADLRQAAVLIEQLANISAEILATAAAVVRLTRLLDIVGGA
jgi:hypothetical protein